MNKLYPLLLLVLCGLALPMGAQVLENFETTPLKLVFNDGRGQGLYEGRVKNPDSTNTVNRTRWVGKYTKDSTAGFSLFIANLVADTKLTATNNQLFIDVYASEATRFITKLEGMGPAIEERLNIPVPNQWRTYRFDLSKATDASTFQRILFFFDFANATGKGTYYIDNIRLGTDPCAGTVRDPAIMDDFACQRQLPLRAGQDSLTIVDNPAPDAVNGPGKVGKFVDPPGGFSALVYNVDGGFDLEARPIVSLKYWAPKANRLLVKLEGGLDGGSEIGVQVDVLNQWQELTFDFSGVAGKNYKSLTIFTNAGVSDPGVVYYFDDIKFTEKKINFLETFDIAATLVVRAKGSNTALNGTVNVIDNPDKSGLNETPKVAEHKKGSAALSAIQILSATALDFSATPQLNMLVWAPDGSKTVTMTAIATGGQRLPITRTIDATMQWVEVGFNFADFATRTDVGEFELTFDGAITEPGRTYYFDQLFLGASSIDPCEGTEPIANLIDNFECQRNVPVTGGLERLKVIDNPDRTAPNTSEKVGEYTHDGTQFSNIVFEFPAGSEPDLAVFNNLVLNLWTPKVVLFGFKLEGSLTGAPNKEIEMMAKSASKWETYRVDFSEVAANKYTKVTIFFNFKATDAVAGTKYYIDNVQFSRGPVSGCVADFETPNTTLFPWGDFANGTVPSGTTVSVIDNPDKSGINVSDKVGRFLESSSTGALPFAGATFNFGAPIVLTPGKKTIKMKVWSADTAVFVLKLERGVNNVSTGDIFSTNLYTTKGQWQELTFDYDAFDSGAAQYTQLTFIPGFRFVPTADREIYFDDIRISDAACGLIDNTREQRRAITDLKAFPNPTSGQLFVEAPASTERLQLFDALGRQVVDVAVNVGVDGGLTELNVDAQAAGFYTVVALDRTGVALARVRVAVTD